MTKQEFVQQMAVAYMRHHGYAPSQGHLREFAELFKQTQTVERFYG